MPHGGSSNTLPGRGQPRKDGSDPVYVMEMLMRFQKVKRHLAQMYKKNPQLSDIAKKMKLPMSRVKQLNRMVSNITSLNAPIGESGGSEFMDLIEDESIVTAVTNLVNSFCRNV